MDVYLVNESTLLTDQQTAEIAHALELQARYHFNQAWHHNAHCFFLPGGANAKIPTSGAVLHFLDTSDQQGALGYHDEDGNEIPYARVFVKDAQNDGTTASEVASHELMELVVDPNCNLCSITADGKRIYAVEVGDAVQGNAYTIAGQSVADFVLPSWFDPNTPATEATSYRKAVSGPYTLAPQGYISYIDLGNLQAGWQQGYGQNRAELPKWSNRIGQRIQKQQPATKAEGSEFPFIA